MKETVNGDEIALDDYRTILRESFASRYVDGRDPWSGEAAMRSAADVLAAHLDAGPARVLDVGTGRGLDAAALASRGHQVTAIDIVATPEWRGVAAAADGRVEFVRTGLLEMPAHAPFDGVLDNGCLHHQHPEEYSAYLRRLHELLAESGVLVVSVYSADATPGSYYRNNDDRLHRQFRRDEIVALLGSAGFALVDVQEVQRTVADLRYLVVTVRKARV